MSRYDTHTYIHARNRGLIIDYEIGYSSTIPQTLLHHQLHHDLRPRRHPKNRPLLRHQNREPLRPPHQIRRVDRQDKARGCVGFRVPAHARTTLHIRCAPCISRAGRSLYGNKRHGRGRYTKSAEWNRRVDP